MAANTFDTLVYPDGTPRTNAEVTITFVSNNTRGLVGGKRIIGKQTVYTDANGKWSIPGPMVGPVNSYYLVRTPGDSDVAFVPVATDGEHWLGDLVVDVLPPSQVVADWATEADIAEALQEAKDYTDVAVSEIIGGSIPDGSISPAKLDRVYVEPSQAFYEHTQASPSSSWTIANPFSRLPLVSILDTSGNTVLADVTVTLVNITVTFAAPFAGKAILR